MCGISRRSQLFHSFATCFFSSWPKNSALAFKKLVGGIWLFFKKKLALKILFVISIGKNNLDRSMASSLLLLISISILGLVSARPTLSFPQFPRRGSRTWRANRADYSATLHQRVSSSNSGSFNVLTYGAKGDNATDNTHPFNAALLAAFKAGGATVNVPTGLYKFKGSLTIPPGLLSRCMTMTIFSLWENCYCQCRCDTLWKLWCRTITWFAKFATNNWWDSAYSNCWTRSRVWY